MVIEHRLDDASLFGIILDQKNVSCLGLFPSSSPRHEQIVATFPEFMSAQNLPQTT